MEFKREAIINKSAANVWEVLGNQYWEAYKWASSLNYSEGFGESHHQSAGFSNRACDTTQGKIKEVIKKFDPVNHILSYEVLDGFPFFVDTGVNTWTLVEKGERTQVYMKCEIKTQGIFGALMTPMMKMQMNKLFDEAVEELKYYIENNREPHPRKVKAQQKLAKKAA